MRPSGEEALLETFALRRIGREHPYDEIAQRLLAPHDAFLGLHQVLYQRAFDRGVLGIERERGLQILLAQGVVPSR